MSAKHQAALLPAAGSPLTLAERDTPEPGPGELLIEVKAVAFNPVDRYQRDMGFPPPLVFPAVLASDVAGVVVKVGPDVPNAPAVGSRIISLATAYYHDGDSNYGAAQQYALTRAERVTPLPDHTSFTDGASLPLAALTALSAYTTIGIPLSTKFKPEDNHGILIWGGSSSVGSLAVQTAKALGYTVYATAGAKNLDYVAKLGAHAVFDHRSPDVVSQIVSRVKQDGTDLRTAHVIVPDTLDKTLEVIKLTKGDGPAKIAHAPVMPENPPTLENTEIKFTYPPTEPAERAKHMHECFRVWMDDALKSGAVVPSPPVEVVPGGLAGANEALDRLKAGVSATKMVISL